MEWLRSQTFPFRFQRRSLGLVALLGSLLFSDVVRSDPAFYRTRVRDDKFLEVAARVDFTQISPETADAPLARACPTVPMAWFGQPVPGFGSLYLYAPLDPPLINDSGRVTVVTQIAGSERNQGIFVSDEGTLIPIVIGCGGAGGSGNPGLGCGDPSPIGGTFSGLFQGTVFAPPINERGDVLFLFDVDGGTSPRGLFLYRASTPTIVKVAAVGDPLPGGGFVGAVSPGSLNNDGVVAFAIRPLGSTEPDIYLWKAGVLTRYVAVGDPAPGGGVFSMLVTESVGCPDGTTIPVGPLPSINDRGQVSFRGIVSGGSVTRGLVLSEGGVHAWAVRVGDPTPAGGTFADFWGPVLSASGEIAFLADFAVPGLSTGWFAGTPGHWRTGLIAYDTVDGGLCTTLASSRSPMTPLDASGNLLMWAEISYPGDITRDHLVVRKLNGDLLIVAGEGDVTPLGGVYGEMNPWPSLDDVGSGTLSAFTPGAPGGVLNAHFRFYGCDIPVSVDPRAGIPAGEKEAAIRVLANPAAGDVWMRLDLGRPLTAARITVHDISGRAVQQLCEGPLAAGSHLVKWSGAAVGGERAASGVYLVRVEAGEISASARLIFVR